jgi:hypothetical protein
MMKIKIPLNQSFHFLYLQQRLLQKKEEPLLEVKKVEALIQRNLNLHHLQTQAAKKRKRSQSRHMVEKVERKRNQKPKSTRKTSRTSPRRLKVLLSSSTSMKRPESARSLHLV